MELVQKIMMSCKAILLILFLDKFFSGKKTSQNKIKKALQDVIIIWTTMEPSQPWLIKPFITYLSSIIFL